MVLGNRCTQEVLCSLGHMPEWQVGGEGGCYHGYSGKGGLSGGITWAGGELKPEARRVKSLFGVECYLFHPQPSEDLLTCCSHTGAWGSTDRLEMELGA